MWLRAAVVLDLVAGALLCPEVFEDSPLFKSWNERLSTFLKQGQMEMQRLSSTTVMGSLLMTTLFFAAILIRGTIVDLARGIAFSNDWIGQIIMLASGVLLGAGIITFLSWLVSQFIHGYNPFITMVLTFAAFLLLYVSRFSPPPILSLIVGLTFGIGMASIWIQAIPLALRLVSPGAKPLLRVALALFVAGKLIELIA